MGKIFDALEKSKVEDKTSVKSGFKGVKTRGKVKDFRSVNKVLFHENQQDENLVSLHNPQSVEAEQFRKLKTQILFPDSGNPPKTIMVTSALPGEGKSFVAANLAINIAQSIDEYVLLMDCDIRIPTIHSSFGFSDDVPGLSDYLSNDDVSLESLLLKTNVGKLTVLPGGSPPANPSELLSSYKMAGLIEEVSSRYKDRFIILDSPPPQLTAEASALAKMVDGILMIVEHGRTRREVVKEVLKALPREKFIGVIMNKFNMSSPLYHRYGSYGDFYG